MKPPGVPEDDELLRQVLRITPEPFVYFDEFQVHRILTRDPSEYLGFLHGQLDNIARGDARRELPPKQIFHDPLDDADFRVMPCVVRMGGAACKIPNLFTVTFALVTYATAWRISARHSACWPTTRHNVLARGLKLLCLGMFFNIRK